MHCCTPPAAAHGGCDKATARTGVDVALAGPSFPRASSSPMVRMFSGCDASAAASASFPSFAHVRFCRYRFKFQSHLVWDLIKPISNFALKLTIRVRLYYKVDLYPNPTAPLYPNSPVGENRCWQNLTSFALLRRDPSPRVATGAACGGVTLSRQNEGGADLLDLLRAGVGGSLGGSGKLFY